MKMVTSSYRHGQPASRVARMLPETSMLAWIPALHAGMTQPKTILLEVTEVPLPGIFGEA